jgi:hypothetical protein
MMEGHEHAEDLESAVAAAFAPSLWQSEPEGPYFLRDTFARAMNDSTLDLGGEFPLTRMCVELFLDIDSDAAPGES